jgi:hypothetical protein
MERQHIAGRCSSTQRSDDGPTNAGRRGRHLLSVLAICEVLLAGCAHFTATSVGLKASESPSISIAGPQDVRGGQSAQFTATVSGLKDTSVGWTVDGIPGGSVNVGTISTAGQYVAPAIGATHILTSTSIVNPSVASEVKVQVLNPVPTITAASIDKVDGSSYILSLTGTGFLNSSLVVANGADANTSYVSSQQLKVEISRANLQVYSATLIVENPAPGASESSPFAFTFPPEYRELQGCSNPNTGSPWGGWGSSGDPVYVDLTYGTQLMTTGEYAQNAVFWMSRENMPGQSVLLQGAFTPSSKTVRFAPIADGVRDWKSVVAASSIVLPTTQQGTTALSFQVPSGMTYGVYGIEIEDVAAQPVFELVNAPSLEWIIGSPDTSEEFRPLERKISPCTAEAGGTIHVYGKNFLNKSDVVLGASDGETEVLPLIQIDPNSAVAQIPAGTPSGQYYVWFGSKEWDAASSPSAIISVAAPHSISYTTTECSSVIADGSTDNTSNVQACLDNYAPVADGAHVAVITLPSGTIVLRAPIQLHAYEILSGSSMSTTEVFAVSSDSQPKEWVSLPAHSGIENLTVNGPDTSMLAGSLDCSGNPDDSGHVSIQSARFVSTGTSASSKVDMIALCGPDILVQNSSFSAQGENSAAVLAIMYGDGALVSSNTFDVSRGHLYIGASQNVAVESSDFSYQTDPDAGQGDTAISISRPFGAFQRSMVSQNIYVGYNAFHDMGSYTNNPVVATDGGGGAYYGGASSSTANTVILANDPMWEWTGVTNPDSVNLVVVSGTGAGQYARLKGVDGRTLTLSTELQVLLDDTSIVELVACHRSLAITHNTFEDNINYQVALFNSIDGAVEDNALSNAGRGIIIQSYGPYGGPAGFSPALYTDVLRNIIAVGSGDRFYSSPNENRAGIGLFNGYGTVMAGIMVRTNSVPSEETIYSTNGWNGVSGAVIEDNSAVWVPDTAPPAFLVQNNSVPKN